jgi:DNA helicase II / ATP-dependent DNA helicase PcrA
MNDKTFFEQLVKAGISLNPQQTEAVRTVEGPVSVFAGPGSGKTTVLTCRLAYMHLVHGVPLSACMVMTFTRAAAQEMTERLKRLPGMQNAPLNGMAIGTFHSIFYRFLQRRSQVMPNILTRAEQKAILWEAIRTVDGAVTEDRYKQVLNRIGLCKNHLIRPEMLKVKEKENKRLKQIFAMYEAFKFQKNKIDYDDILVLTFEWLVADPVSRTLLADRFRYFVVDEFQDTNWVQYRILQTLADSKNVFVVGDDDQAIYGFRGANVKFMLDFQQDYPDAKQIVLGTNYRSTETLIRHTSALIQNNTKRWPKQISGTGREGTKPIILYPANASEEAETIVREIRELTKNGHTLERIAVLYRTHLQVRNFVEVCIRSDVPFFLHDSEQSFYEVWYIRNILQYLALSMDPDDLESLFNILNRPKRYVHVPQLRHQILSVRTEKRVTGLDALSELAGLEGYQRRYLKQFQNDVKRLATMPPKQAIETVLHSIGYMRYVEDYCKQLGLDLKEVQDELEAFVELAEPFPAIPEFLAHVQNVREHVTASRNNRQNGLQLMTFHKAKGLEYQAVFIIGAVDGMVPHHKSCLGLTHSSQNNKKQSPHPDALEEERRLFYVACTRAQNHLVISAPVRYLGQKSQPSPFIRELMDVVADDSKHPSVSRGLS